MTLPPSPPALRDLVFKRTRQRCEYCLRSRVGTLSRHFKALGDRGRTPRFLRTLHGQSYRFVAAVAVREPLAANVTASPSYSPQCAVLSRW